MLKTSQDYISFLGQLILDHFQHAAPINLGSTASHSRQRFIKELFRIPFQLLLSDEIMRNSAGDPGNYGTAFSARSYQAICLQIIVNLFCQPADLFIF